ncbi:MAG: DsbA family protein [Veillonellaceae bacterium]|nr:DsbA family protein [Veillonellaceae bacterium]
MRKIRVYFDFVCPYCFHEWANIRHWQAEHATREDLPEIEWYGWEIHPERQGQPATATQYTDADIEYFAALGEVPEVNATERRWNASSHAALRLLEEAKHQGKADAWVDRVFKGSFQEGADISDRETLLAWAYAISLANADDVLNDKRYADVLLDHDRHCAEIGLEYVPSLEENGEIRLAGVLHYEETADFLDGK